jgi:hypothetical protein
LTAQGREGFQLVWPTVEEVRNSVEGWAAGASVPGPEKNVSKPFLQGLWHPWGGAAAGRQRAMPHMKSYTRYRWAPCDPHDQGLGEGGEGERERQRERERERERETDQGRKGGREKT